MVIAIKWHGFCDEHLDLVEFSYNNSYKETIQMAPFETFYRRKHHIFDLGMIL